MELLGREFRMRSETLRPAPRRERPASVQPAPRTFKRSCVSAVGSRRSGRLEIVGWPGWILPAEEIGAVIGDGQLDVVHKT